MYFQVWQPRTYLLLRLPSANVGKQYKVVDYRAQLGAKPILSLNIPMACRKRRTIVTRWLRRAAITNNCPPITKLQYDTLCGWYLSSFRWQRRQAKAIGELLPSWRVFLFAKDVKEGRTRNTTVATVHLSPLAVQGKGSLLSLMRNIFVWTKLSLQGFLRFDLTLTRLLLGHLIS